MKTLLRAAATFLVLFAPIFCPILPANAEPLDMNAYRGKVVLLDFWASWCNPCRKSFPWMNAIAETMGPKGLVVIAVNVDHNRELADAFLQNNHAEFKIVYDPSGKIAKQYAFRDMPTSFLIGKDGRVRYLHSGFFPERESQYYADIVSLLDQKAP